MQIQCTQKLLNALGTKISGLGDIGSSDTLLGNWYANIFTLDRKQTIIFMNERTLLSFIIYGIRKDNVRNFPLVFVHGVEQLLTIEGFEDFIIDRVLEEYSQISLAKTTNKSLLGNMNDLVNLYTDYVLHEGGFKHADLPDIIHKINRTPQRNLVCHNSIEAAREILNKASQ